MNAQNIEALSQSQKRKGTPYLASKLLYVFLKNRGGGVKEVLAAIRRKTWL